VRLVNVDGPGDAPPTPFEREWVEPRTYKRWADMGSLYGFTSHSGAMLSVRCKEPPLWRHFAEMYFDQMLLLLYLRVGTFRFSRRLSEISTEARRAKEQGAADKFLAEFQRLRWAFALFTNLYRFPLLSSQQQGVEMYAIARQHLDVDQLFQEVQQEIEASEEYVNGVAQAKQTTAQTVLSIVATVALTVALGLAWVQVRPGGSARAADWGDFWVTVWLLVPSIVAAVLLLATVRGARPTGLLDKLFSCLTKPRSGR
jgi:ABC-type Fe3+ transport system permease subunit